MPKDNDKPVLSEDEWDKAFNRDDAVKEIRKERREREK